MRILHVAEATFAGVGRHVVDLVRAQADMGHEVVVLYGTVRESDRFRRARERVGNAQWRPMAVARRPDKADLKALQTIRALARGFRPDVVHGHSTKGGMLARSVPAGDWKVVYTPHAIYSMNPELGRRARSGVDLVERKLSTRTDTVIAVSPEEEAHLRMMSIEASKIRMIPNGIPPITRANSELVRRALNVATDRPVIGFVGRLDEQKAPHDLLDIFKRIAVARPKVDFLIVGDGPLRPALQERADVSRALAGRVHIVGEQPGPWAMSGMDVLILPSRYEGMPYVLIEAAHLGLPMVVSRAAGSSLLQNGPATILEAEVGDVSSLANACIGLIDLWPDRMPGERDERFTLEGMAHLTELAYLGRSLELIDPAPPTEPDPLMAPTTTEQVIRVVR
jgi:glycosyltransferase involved in cell wall biosynthesis